VPRDDECLNFYYVGLGPPVLTLKHAYTCGCAESAQKS